MKDIIKNEKLLLIDGICNFCVASVHFILKFEKNNSIKFANLQEYDFSFQPSDSDSEQYNSLIYLLNGKSYQKSQAVFLLAKELKFPFSLVQYFSFLPQRFTDFCYDLIAKNRYRIFGEREVCFVPDEEVRERFISLQK